MSIRFRDGALIVVILALVAVTALWQFQESPDQAYEQGRQDALDEIDNDISDTLYNPDDWVANVGRRNLLAKIPDTICFDSTDTMPAVEYGPPYPWFWSDSAVLNDKYWICPNDYDSEYACKVFDGSVDIGEIEKQFWANLLPSCVLRDSFPDICILRFPEMIGLWPVVDIETMPAIPAGSWIKYRSIDTMPVIVDTVWDWKDTVWKSQYPDSIYPAFYSTEEDCVDAWLNGFPEEERGLITIEILLLVEEWCNEIRDEATSAVEYTHPDSIDTPK